MHVHLCLLYVRGGACLHYSINRATKLRVHLLSETCITLHFLAIWGRPQGGPAIVWHTHTSDSEESFFLLLCMCEDMQDKRNCALCVVLIVEGML